MSDEHDDRLVCAIYTHARRHPLVIGRLAGWTSPVQLSVLQLAVIGVTFFIELKTWHWWARLLPRYYALGIAIALPLLLAWVIRRVRIEGRSLPRVALGWALLLASPREGRAGGRALRRTRARDLRAAPVYLASGRDPR